MWSAKGERGTDDDDPDDEGKRPVLHSSVRTELNLKIQEMSFPKTLYR